MRFTLYLYETTPSDAVNCHVEIQPASVRRMSIVLAGLNILIRPL